MNGDRPVDFLFSNPLVEGLSRTLPGMQAILAAPVSVEDVAAAAVSTSLGLHRKQETAFFCPMLQDVLTFSVQQIKDIASQVRKAMVL